jgi:hypothetical protein
MAFPLTVSTIQAAYNVSVDIVRDGTPVNATPIRRAGRASSEQDCSLQLYESVSANAGVRVSPQIAGAIKAVPDIAQVEAVYAGQRQRSRD